ncbi:MAG: YesL family protein [Oscillospiraceae bacterium]|nr:YesL family protein [Oscillospiraceae bacterium]MBP5167649.1 YesL family protein [Oscillospiraceae bacterium]
MKKESRIVQVLSALIDLVWAGLLWLACSLPLFTIGASSTALYYTIVKCIRHDRGRVSSCFFRSFRTNFRQATIIWLLCILYILIGIGDCIAFSRMGISKDSPLILFSRLFFLPVPLLFPWLFSFLSRFQNTVAGTFRFSVYLAMKNFGRTLLLTLQLTLFLLICWMIPFLTPFLPGVFCMLMSLTIEPVFREMTSDMGAENEDAWYNE